MRLVCGPASLEALPSELGRLGMSRPLLLHPRSLAGGRLIGQVRDLTAPVAIFSAVRAHTPLSSVLAAAEQAERARVDGLIALGGGSATVTARATAIVLAEGRDIAALESRRGTDGRIISPKLTRPKVPIVVIPTTPSTAHSKAGTAVTTPERMGRLALFDPKTRARSLIVDPKALATAPQDLVRHAALTAFVMAAEGLTTRKANLVAEADLSAAVSWLADGLHSGTDGDTRTTMAVAALLVGAGTDTTGGGMAAALSHTLGHYVGRHNGIVDAIVLPHVLDHMTRLAPERLRSLSHVLGCRAEDTPEIVRRVVAGAGVPSRLRELSVARAVLDEVAEHAMHDYAVWTSGCEVTPTLLKAILGDAW